MRCKNFKFFMHIGFMVTILLIVSCYNKPGFSSSSKKRVRNVIVLIPDGCGIAHMTIARWFKGAPLTQDSMNVSLMKTYNSGSMITGSAAASTAFATGFKTLESKPKAQCLGMLPDSAGIPETGPLQPEQQWRPVATVLEGARLQGKSTGLIATSRISHATPAAFSSHWHSRYDDNCIIEQMVYQNIDVVFGGGYRYLVPRQETIPGTTSMGKRTDGDNLRQILLGKGYKIISTSGELEALTPDAGKVWGMFAHNHMVHDIEREELAPDEPSIARMTGKALEILNRNPKGFFLMVEGSQIDWSAHDNDPVGVVTDYLAFDKAVKTAFDFARSKEGAGTLVLVFSDHDNGGMSLGRRDRGISDFLPRQMTEVIRKAKFAAEGVETMLLGSTDRLNPNQDTVRAIMDRYFGLSDLEEEELAAILAEFGDSVKTDSYGKPVLDTEGRPIADPDQINFREVIGPMLSRRAGIGWTSYDHTGNDVPMFSYGLQPVPQTLENSDIARLCANAMGFNLEAVNKRLIADAADLFPGGSLLIDSSGAAQGKGCLRVTKNQKTAAFPFHKNIAVIGKDTLAMEGLTIYSMKSHKVYLPAAAGSLLP